MTRSLPPDWGYRREEALEEHGYECANCGKSGRKGGPQLDVHHIVPREVGGTHKISNLTPLCKPCHIAAHHTDIQAPTGGPSIDYDKAAEVMKIPPDLRSENEKQYLTEVREKLRKYAGENYWHYLPLPDENTGTPPSSTSHPSRSKTNPDIWSDLKAKWAENR